MAAIVPVSHSQRWRSRSRNQSLDLLEGPLRIQVPQDPQHHQHQQHPHQQQHEMTLHPDSFRALRVSVRSDEAADEDEDEAMTFDDVQGSPWLVVPQGFMSPAQPRAMGSPAISGPGSTPRTWEKAMEMRRPSGF